MKKLIVIKHSKYEWERLNTGMSHDDIVSKYTNECANLEAILQGHEKQIKAREAFKTAFHDSDSCFLSELLPDVDKNYDLIIVVGGDNSFTMVSHKVFNATILGVNSDPQRSSGHLTRWAINQDDDVFELREKLDYEEYSVEKWTRLGALLDGTQIIPATSEYYIGERMRDKMSRHVLEYRGNKYEQKCSGMIVATGAGSTGWFKYANKLNGSWDPCDKHAGFSVTELFEPKDTDVRAGAVQMGEEIIIHSLNDDNGCVSVDAWDHFEFQRGSSVHIYIEIPLNVLVPRRT